MASEVQAWRKKILDQLEKRKFKETNQFQDLIQSHEKLLNYASIAKLRNSELELQTFQLKQEILELQGQIAVGGSNGTNSTNSDQNLAQKIYKLQEELTEVHRTKGEHANTIIQLTSTLKEKDTLIAQKEAEILDAQNNLEALRRETSRLHSAMANLETTSQTIKDEYQALQLLYNSMEEKLIKTQTENMQLVERWMIEKAKVADQVNLENELVASLRQQQLQEQLQDAANEPIHIKKVSPGASNPRTQSVSSIPPPAFICITSVPDRPIQSLECHDGEVTALRFSVSGRYFVTGGSDRKVKVWEVGRGSCNLTATLNGCTASVMCTRFDLSERLILASSNDNACRIWNLSGNRLMHTLTGHTGKVYSAKFLGTDSSKIVSGSHDRTLKLWDLRSKVCTKTIFAGSSCNDLVTSDQAGTTIISGHFDKKIRFWDIRCDQDINEIQLQGKVTSLDLSQDMNYLLSCSRDDSLKLIDLRTSQIVSTYKTDGFKVAFDYTRACFSPDGQYVMCGAYDGSVFVWNTKTNHLEKILKEHKNAVVATAWHPNGTCLLSCDKNKHVVLWTDV
ncbi:autophagy-related protein 16-1-like [Hydractinia symbiolongicarpus]|uniref:autophagy-related protein 16-1-like n=1 Tax=Hydractinia symbiolongicarpus TaxID=13093 RepID=UPI00254BF30E|nr:autophagy-related protein 16-1-like [Hydractinia symbiolongicarpus]